MGSIPARRTIVLFVFAVLFSVQAFAKSKPVSPPAPEARAVLLFDQKTKTVLEGVNIHQRIPIASISKLITAYVVLESGVDLDERIKIPTTVVEHSRILQTGAVVSRRELLYMALITSDNVAARTLATAHPGGYNKFVATMNMTARSLGMTNTGFADASGLSVFNTSTAWDLHLLNAAIAKYSIFNDTAMSRTATQQVEGLRGQTKRFIIRNTSALAGEFDLQLGKTGFTNAAQWCIDMQIKHEGRLFDVIILGAPSKETRNKLAKQLVQKYTVGSNVKIEQLNLSLGN